MCSRWLMPALDVYDPLAFSKAMACWAEAQLCACFHRQFGYALSLHAPQTLRENLFALMVRKHRRHTPRYAWLSDKLAVRRYVQHCIGAHHLSPIAWVGTDPAQAPLERYSHGGWIAKTNYACGGYRLIKAGEQRSLRQHLQQQLEQNYYWMALEAQCFKIEPHLYIEQLVQGVDQPPPLSYRLWCFGH